MDYGASRSLIITESVIEKIMKQVGIENLTVIFRGNDYIVSVLKAEEAGFDLEIKNVQKLVSKEDIVQMVLTIDGKRYFLTLKVSGMRSQDGRLIIETKIVGNVCLEVKNKTDELLKALRFLDLRNLQRIDMDDETLQLFNIIPRMKIVLPKREYVAYIKNISPQGINFLTTKNFMEDNSEFYMLNINFSSPAENISVGGEVLRKSVISVSGTEFVEVAMSLKENIYLNKRIMDYLKKKGEVRAAIKQN